MKKLLFISIILILFLNLGNIVDITNKDIQQSDVIIVLGGGGIKRIKSGLMLYKNKDSISNKIIITGNGKLYKKMAINFLIENNLEEKNITYIGDVFNTMEELIVIKKYLLKNNFRNIIIVSEPTHSLRIKLMANFLLDYQKENINITYASADATGVWDKQFYFLERKSMKLVSLELSKIIYNFIKYSNYLVAYSK